MPLFNKGTKEVQKVMNADRVCIICKQPYTAVSYVQKTCSEPCRKVYYASIGVKWRSKNGFNKKYNEARIAKNPNYWRDKTKNERLQIIEKLGGVCCVPNCGVTNLYHLHVDYKPTMQGTGKRHARHKGFIFKNLRLFRLICANHHYELTLTGRIEGTTIVQKCKNKL